MQQHAGRARVVILCLLLALLCHFWITAAEPPCKQQGLLMLDEPHPPYRVRLPFCDKYRCSCCNASHALAIQRSVAHLLADEEIGLACKAGLVLLACRLCDPQVGVGNVTSVCASTCDEVYEACSEDYFAFDESTGHITPCSSQLSSSLVCSQLQQIVPAGADFCRAAGYTPSEGSSSSSSSSSSSGMQGACFDGSPVAADACSSAAPPHKQQGSSKASSSSSSSSSSKRRSKKSSSSSSSGIWPFIKLKRRHKRKLAEVAQIVLGALTSSLVAAAIVLLLQRVMQPAVLSGAAAGRGQPAGLAQAASSRDRLARAAEARAAATGSTAAASGAASATQQQQRRR